MSKPLRIVILLIVLLGGGAAAFVYFSSEPPAGRLTLYGNVDIREVDLGFRVQGKLEEMRVEEGDGVRAGDVVALLDCAPYRQELAAARARSGKVAALLQKLKNGSRPQEIQGGEAQVAEAEAAYTNALRDLKRQEELVAGNATSRKAYEQATARHDETAARLQAARERLALLKEGSRHEDITAGEAELKEAEAQLQLASIRVEDCSLKAPSDGVIAGRIREPGAIVSPAMAVYTLSLPDPVYIRAYIGEPDLGDIAPGTRVEITTDSKATVYRGTVGFISPRAEFTPKSVETPELRTDLVYRLRIVARDTDNGLRHGMPVTITVVPPAADTTGK